SKISEQIIEITTIESIENQEAIIVPLIVKFEGAEGDAKVTVNARDSRVSSGSYTFAISNKGETIANLNKKPLHVFEGDSISLNDALILFIDESYPGLLNNGDVFRV